MHEIADYAERVLILRYIKYINQPEHINSFLEPCGFAEWCKIEAQYDYKFYRWLFADNTIKDYGKNLSGEELQKAIDFFKSLEISFGEINV